MLTTSSTAAALEQLEGVERLLEHGPIVVEVGDVEAEASGVQSGERLRSAAIAHLDAPLVRGARLAIQRAEARLDRATRRIHAQQRRRLDDVVARGDQMQRVNEQCVVARVRVPRVHLGDARPLVFVLVACGGGRCRLDKIEQIVVVGDGGEVGAGEAKVRPVVVLVGDGEAHEETGGPVAVVGGEHAQLVGVVLLAVERVAARHHHRVHVVEQVDEREVVALLLLHAAAAVRFAARLAHGERELRAGGGVRVAHGQLNNKRLLHAPLAHHHARLVDVDVDACARVSVVGIDDPDDGRVVVRVVQVDEHGRVDDRRRRRRRLRVERSIARAHHQPIRGHELVVERAAAHVTRHTDPAAQRVHLEQLTRAARHRRAA